MSIYFHPVVSKIRLSILSLFFCLTVTTFFGATEAKSVAKPEDEKENSLDLFSVESTYTFSGDIKNKRFGDGDSLYDDFSYDHRFLITGKWYFRAGVEYERYEFGGTDNGLPDHLQAAYAHVAVEYVVRDHAAVSLELSPGVYFQNKISSDAFDMPVKGFVTFPLKKDKIFGVIGAGGALYQHPIVAPGGGIIWLISDNMRLQGVFPKPALVYNANDDWEFRIMGELNYTSFRTDDVITPARGFRLHNAVVEYSEDRAGVEVRYTGFEPFKVIAGGGYTFRRNFDFFRARERALVDPAPFLRLSVEAKF